MISVNGLKKRYGKNLAVDNVHLEAKPSELTILLGPNGAGKSTTIKSIAGLLNFEGSINICGYPNKSVEAKRVFGYVPETPALYDLLTIREHIQFMDMLIRKVFYSIQTSAWKAIFDGTLAMVLAFVLFRPNVATALSSWVMLAGFMVLFLSSGVFSQRWMGKYGSVYAQSLLRMLFMVIAIIPSVLLGVVINVLWEGADILMLSKIFMAIFNVILSLVLISMSKKLFEQSELMM